ncbi:MAG TPA: hypothetical protein VFT28_04370, partial [Gemmatimonadales bacterium]|nr:hypothetical protein [Gemmatimonadales bacterium]
MRVQLETCKVRHPGQRGRVARDDLLGGPAGRERECHGVQPLGTRGWRTLLEEELPFDAVGVTDEHVRPAAGATQCTVGHGQVIAHEIAFGVAGLRKQHLVGVGDRNLVPIDRQDLGVPSCRHGCRYPDIESSSSQRC